MADLKIYDMFDVSPLRDYILAHGQRRRLKKRETYISMNAPTDEWGIVISGGFSYSRSDHKGDTQILSFAFAGEFITAYINAGQLNRSFYDITALCDSEIATIPAEEIISYMNTALPPDYRVEFTKAVASGILLRAISCRCESPEERYRELLTRIPGIDSMIPMTAIASYLGITRETFARLRKKLKSVI